MAVVSDSNLLNKFRHPHFHFRVSAFIPILPTETPVNSNNTSIVQSQGLYYSHLCYLSLSGDSPGLWTVILLNTVCQGHLATVCTVICRGQDEGQAPSLGIRRGSSRRWGFNVNPKGRNRDYIHLYPQCSIAHIAVEQQLSAVVFFIQLFTL